MVFLKYAITAILSKWEFFNRKVYFLYYQYSIETQLPIDVVYTWVNGTDNLLKFPKELIQKDFKRWRDNDELKYSLRSIEKFLPWIRNIIIVTNGQIPNWLNIKHPKIKIVSHETLFEDKKDLPTFNSASIEFNLHKITGLSDKFIYFNDDMLIGKPLSLSDFWTKETGTVIDFHYPTPLCKEECAYEMIGDGVCNFQCLVQQCKFDFGDCLRGITYNLYNESCPTDLIGDGICQENCNTLVNAFDAGDCKKDKSVKEKLAINLNRNYIEYDIDYKEPYLKVFYYDSFPSIEKFEVRSDKPNVVRAIRKDPKNGIIYLIFYKEKHQQVRFYFESVNRRFILDVFFTITSPKSDAYGQSLTYTNLVLNEFYKKREQRYVIHHRVSFRNVLTWAIFDW